MPVESMEPFSMTMMLTVLLYSKVFLQLFCLESKPSISLLHFRHLYLCKIMFTKARLNPSIPSLMGQGCKWLPQMGMLANSGDPYEMLLKAAFHHGLHCLLRQNRSSEKEIQYFVELLPMTPQYIQWTILTLLKIPLALKGLNLT